MVRGLIKLGFGDSVGEVKDYDLEFMVLRATVNFGSAPDISGGLLTALKTANCKRAIRATTFPTISRIVQLCSTDEARRSRTRRGLHRRISADEPNDDKDGCT